MKKLVISIPLTGCLFYVLSQQQNYEKAYKTALEKFPQQAQWIHYLNKLMLNTSLLKVELTQEQKQYLKGQIGGIKCDSVIGLAAGYDQNGDCINGILNLGFGSVEVGSVTSSNEATTNYDFIINNQKQLQYNDNCMSNWGILKAKANLTSYRNSQSQQKSIGISIAPSRKTREYAPYLCVDEIVQSSQQFIDVSDYLIINISGPESQGLEEFYSPKSNVLRNTVEQIQKIRSLEIGLLACVQQELQEQNDPSQILLKNMHNISVQQIQTIFPKIFVKINADVSNDFQQYISDVCLKSNLDGIIIGKSFKCNFSILFKEEDESHIIQERNQIIQNIYKLTKGQIFSLKTGQVEIISSGYIKSGKDVVEQIKNGSSSVQIFSQFFIQGPFYLNQLNQEIIQELKLANVSNIMSLRGQNVK